MGRISRTGSCELKGKNEMTGVSYQRMWDDLCHSHMVEYRPEKGMQTVIF